MSSVTIINGSNVVARSVIRRLAPLYSHIRVCDFKPYRESVATLTGQPRRSTIC